MAIRAELKLVTRDKRGFDGKKHPFVLIPSKLDWKLRGESSKNLEGFGREGLPALFQYLLVFQGMEQPKLPAADLPVQPDLAYREDLGADVDAVC